MSVDTQQPAEEPTDPRLDTTVVHRRYVRPGDTSRDGLAEVSYSLGLVTDAAIEVCLRTDGEEGQLVGLAEVDFLSPLFGGDVVETRATVLRVGTTSRELGFELRVLCRSTGNGSRRGQHYAGAPGEVLDEPLVVLRARGTVVVGHK